MKKYLKVILLCLIGGFLYICTELAWRGRTHWTMFFLGGVCAYLVGLINQNRRKCVPLVRQGIIGSIIITTLEFFTGLIVNLWLEWDVWDYSNLPFNLCGQICLLYSVLWFFFSIIIVLYDDELRNIIYKEKIPHYCLIRHKRKGE